MIYRQITVYGIVGLSDFVSSLLVFAVTRTLAEQGAGTFAMGLVGGGYAATISLSTFFGGRLADRVGHVRIILWATLFLLPCVLVIAMADSRSWPFVAAYIMAGLGTGSVYPASMVWLTLDQQRTASFSRLILYCLAWNLGMVSGHASAGQLFGIWGPSAVLYFAAGVLPFMLGFVVWGSRKTNKTQVDPDAHEAQTTYSNYQVQLAGAFTWLSWVANVGGTFAMSMVLYLLPALAVEIGISSQYQGGIVALSRCVVILTYLCMTCFKHWRFRFLGAASSQILAIVGLVYMAFAQNGIQLTLGLATFSILPAYNYFASLFYSTVGSAVSERGTWCGIHETTLGIGLTLGAVLGGWVGQHNVRFCFLLAASAIGILTMIQAILYAKLVAPRRASSKIAGGINPDW